MDLIQINALLEILEDPLKIVELMRNSKHKGKISKEGSIRAFCSHYHVVTSLAKTEQSTGLLQLMRAEVPI